MLPSDFGSGASPVTMLSTAITGAALAALVYSFFVDVLWLWRRAV